MLSDDDGDVGVQQCEGWQLEYDGPEGDEVSRSTQFGVDLSMDTSPPV
jgi:hypothetical protein